MDKFNSPNSFDAQPAHQTINNLTGTPDVKSAEIQRSDINIPPNNLKNTSPAKPTEIQRNDINIPLQEMSHVRQFSDIDFGPPSRSSPHEGRQELPPSPYSKGALPSPYTNSSELKSSPFQRLRSWIAPKEPTKNNEVSIAKRSQKTEAFLPSIGKETLGSEVDSPNGDPWSRKAGWAEYNEYQLRKGWGEGEIGSEGELTDPYIKLRNEAALNEYESMQLLLSGPGLLGSSVDSPDGDPWSRKAGWDEYNEWKLREGWGEGEVGAYAELTKHDEWADKAMLAEYHEWKERSTWGNGSIGSDAET